MRSMFGVSGDANGCTCNTYMVTILWLYSETVSRVNGVVSCAY